MHAKQAHISAGVIEQMVRKCKFKMSNIRVELSNKLATTEMLVHFGPEDVYPISRFPRSLVPDEDSRISQSCISVFCFLTNVHVFDCRNPTQGRD